VCSCCEGQLEYADVKRGYRSKACKSPDCPGTEKLNAWNAEAEGTKKFKKGRHKKKSSQEKGHAGKDKRCFYADRDVLAGVNFCLIDKSECEGQGRPARFQSEYYKRRQTASSSLTATSV
jgi:hypothetical protein